MKKWINVCIKNDALGAWVVMLVSIGLVVTSFFLPPKGQIDPSVLTAIGELGLMATIFFKLPNMISSIKEGTSLTFRHGDREMTVHKPNQE